MRVGASHKNPTRRWRYKNKTIVLFFMDSSISGKRQRERPAKPGDIYWKALPHVHCPLPMPGMEKDRSYDRSFPIFFGRLDEKKFCLLQGLRYGSFVKETSRSCYKSIKSSNIMSSCVPAAVSPSGGRRRTPPAPPGSPPPGCRQPTRGGGENPP